MHSALLLLPLLGYALPLHVSRLMGLGSGQLGPFVKEGDWSRVLRKVSPSIDQIMNFCSAEHKHGELVCLAHCTVFYGTENVVKIGCETNYPDPKAWKRCFCYILDDVKLVPEKLVGGAPLWQVLPTRNETPTPSPPTTTLHTTTSTLPQTSTLPSTTLATTTEAPSSTLEEVPLEPEPELKLPIHPIPLEGPKDENDIAEEIAEEEEDRAELENLIHKEMMTVHEEEVTEEGEKTVVKKIIIHQAFPKDDEEDDSTTTELPTTTVPESTTVATTTPATTATTTILTSTAPPTTLSTSTIATTTTVTTLPPTTTTVQHAPQSVVEEERLPVVTGGLKAESKHLHPYRIQSSIEHITGGYFIYKPVITPEDWNKRSDCQVGDWGEWHRCTRTCGGGRMARLRSVTSLPSGEGNQCPKLFETEVCNTEPCPIQDCEVSEWRTVEWCRGAAACEGSQVRLRTITIVPHNGGTPCPPLYDVQACSNILPECIPTRF